MTPLSGLSVALARRTIAAHLASHGIETPELDARLLLGAILGLDLTGLVRAAMRQLKKDEAQTVWEVTERRAGGEPIARILGHAEFWGLPLKLSRATLVPRPETELVVDTALTLVERMSHIRALAIADLGTGSGAILLALLSRMQSAQGIGTDISIEALATARRNAEALNLARRARFAASDYGAALGGRFDLIVANPPYIPRGDIAGLAREVRDHDPLAALDGGPDGLAAYRVIAADSGRLLKSGGVLAVEVGLGQADTVAAMMVNAGLRLCGPPRADLNGIPRVVAALRP